MNWEVQSAKWMQMVVDVSADNDPIPAPYFWTMSFPNSYSCDISFLPIR
jgi:hypothetical protein